jgi:hypothetical protein
MAHFIHHPSAVHVWHLGVDAAHRASCRVTCGMSQNKLAYTYI